MKKITVNSLQKHNRRGIALMLVMVAVLITGGMAVAYFGSRDNSIAISKNITSSANARTVAESGLDIAVAILETNSDWRIQHIDGRILENYAIGQGTVSVSIIDTDTELPPTESTLNVRITVESTVDGRTQRTEANATIIPDEEAFDVDFSEFAVFAENRISMSGSSTIQNWSAAPETSNQNVHIGTLSTSPMSVRFDSSRSRGNLELHTPEHASSMVASKSIATNHFSDSLPFLDSPPPPIDSRSLMLSQKMNKAFDASDWVDRFVTNRSTYTFTRSPSAIVVDEGSYEMHELSLTPNLGLEIHGDVVISIEDDFSMSHSEIILVGDSTLTVHFGGDVDITSSYIGNETRSTRSWMDPTRVQLFGHENDDWNISGSSTLKGEIYAPSGDITLSGSTTLCGRIAGEEVTLRGSSSVLYDPSLDNGGFADSDGMLYEENGDLVSEVRQLTELSPTLLDSIEHAISSTDTDDYNLNSYNSRWQSEPTPRPHEVIYVLLVYGVDTERWEDLARRARRDGNSTFAWADLE